MRKTLPPNAILIPDTAKQVFAGVIFDVYQWPQTMFDGRTETFEMLRRPDTVKVLLVRSNQILLINDAQPVGYVSICLVAVLTMRMNPG